MHGRAAGFPIRPVRHHGSGIGSENRPGSELTGPTAFGFSEGGNAATGIEKDGGTETERDTGATATEQDHHQQRPASQNAPVPANPDYGAGQFPTYEADIANAGIVSPTGWLDTTGEQLCNDWAAGEGTSQTDQQLLAGGIYPQHLAIFDQITNNDLCPGLTPGP